MTPRRLLFGTSSDRSIVAAFLRNETVGGALMLVAAAAALVWAQLDHHGYEAVRTFGIGPLDLESWSSDGLLTIFFFVAGLELKRELTVGSLARPADALVPIVAAVCGMIVPAGIYLLINLGLPGGRPEGWAVPMATDIAFALAVLAIVGRRLPASLRAFLLTLAIVDDLGAIIVIATIFTDTVRLGWLLAALACVAIWWLLQRRRIDNGWLYPPLAVLAWICTFSSGVHPTIAGVALGLATRCVTNGPDAPAIRWEHRWSPVSAAVAVPLFALLAAGVEVSPKSLASMVTEPLALGIVIGLVIGKAVGVFGGAFLTARFTRAELAPDLRWVEVFSVALLAGIGFTVALLVSDLAFGAAAADHAKIAVLLGSIMAAVLAAISLARRDRARRQVPVRVRAERRRPGRG